MQTICAASLKDVLLDKPHWYVNELLQAHYDLALGVALWWLNRDGQDGLDADITCVLEKKKSNKTPQRCNIFIVDICVYLTMNIVSLEVVC